MSRESVQLSNSFLPAYKAPEVEWEYEFHAIGTDVEAGLIDPQLRDEAIAALQSCVDNPDKRSLLTLQLLPIDPEDAPSDETGNYSHQTTEPRRETEVRVADMPPSTHQLLGRLFELTGTSAVRDDIQEENGRGFIVRKGSFKGSDIYFRETYGAMHENSAYPMIDSGRLKVEVMGAARGREALKQLSLEEERELSVIIGNTTAAQRASRVEYCKRAGELPLVNRDNYSAMMSLLGAASNARIEKVREEAFNGRRIRRFLASLVIDSEELFPPKPPKLRYVGRVSREAYDRAAQDPYVQEMLARVRKRLEEHPEDFSSGQAT
jgi:hypothetical protein